MLRPMLLIGEMLANAARVAPNAGAATLGDDMLTFGALDERANRIANGLHGLSVGRGDRVLWWSETALDAVPVFCEAPNDELLLVEWLNALVYEMAVRAMVFGDFSIEIDGRTLRGTAYGEAVDIDRHEPAVEIKGATLTALHVGQDADGWHAQCVVDV